MDEQEMQVTLDQPDIEEQPTPSPQASIGVSTVCEHAYRFDGFAEGNLTSVVCEKCWHGCMIDTNLFTLQNGIITKL